MSKFEEKCLLCLTNINLEPHDDDDDGNNGSTLPSGREMLSLSLCQLVQNKMFEGSTTHQNIFSQINQITEICILCQKCGALTDDMVAITDQIVALNALHWRMVGILRESIIDSDGQGIDQPSSLHQLRQSILSLSDENEVDHSASQVDVEVKVEIQDDYVDYGDYHDGSGEQEEDNYLSMNGFHQNHRNENQPFMNEGNDAEEGLVGSPFINIQNPRNVRGDTTISAHNQMSALTSPPIKRGRGRPRKILNIDNLKLTTLKPKPRKITKNHHLHHPTSTSTSTLIPTQMKRGRGRPRKYFFKKYPILKMNPIVPKKPKTLTKPSKLYPRDGGSSFEPNSSDPTSTFFSCELCSKSFTDENTRIIHTSIHQNPSLLNCPSCDAKCVRRADFELHCKGHETNEPAFLCYVCFKPFRWKKDMMRHVRKNHLHERTYTCLYCNQRFHSSEELCYHISEIHPKRRSFACPHCNKRYSQKRYLQKHIQTEHTVEVILP